MNLSEAYDKYKEPPDKYACCVMCHTAWLDDMCSTVHLMCPKCGGNGSVLYRGAGDPKEYGCTLDDGSAVAPVAEPWAYNINKGRPSPRL